VSGTRARALQRPYGDTGEMNAGTADA